MTLEEAVEKLTSRAADIYRIKDRGRLQVGAWADFMLFDPNTVGRGEKRRVQDLPAGATRVDTPAVGLHGVWVNGVRTVDDGARMLQIAASPDSCSGTSPICPEIRRVVLMCVSQ